MISGKTSIVAHLGYPTESFKAPLIYNPYFESIGVDAVVVPMGVKPEDYAQFLPPLFKLSNIAGALVTMPHKVASLVLVDEISTAAKIAGACNAIKRAADGRLIGDMFDGEALYAVSNARDVRWRARARSSSAAAAWDRRSPPRSPVRAPPCSAFTTSALPPPMRSRRG
jgi:shikimate 5-dehydrogenase